MTFYPIMFMAYIALCAHWCYFLNRYKDHLINLHYYVLVVIIVTLGQTLSNIALLQYINTNGYGSNLLSFVSFLFDILSNVISRVVTLIVGLGYGILIKSIQRYKTKIILISFLYSMGFLANHGINLINKSQPVSGAVAFIVSLPLACINAIFVIWIFFAFRRTMFYLKSRN